MVLLAALLIAGLVSACAGPGSESRSPGEAAFRSSCGGCHSLPRPSLKGDDEWPALVERYGQRARLDDERIKLITAWLRANN